MGNQSSQWFALYYLTDTGKVIKRLRTSNKRRFKRRMERFQKQYREGEITLFTKSKEDSDEKIKA